MPVVKAGTRLVHRGDPAVDRVHLDTGVAQSEERHSVGVLLHPDPSRRHGVLKPLLERGRLDPGDQIAQRPPERGDRLYVRQNQPGSRDLIARLRADVLRKSCAARPWQTRGMRPHDVVIDGLANVRDLGGLAVTGGSLTPTGVFLRAEALDRVSAKGWEALRRHGVRTVVDLRRPDERTGKVPDDIRVVGVDLDGDERDFWAAFEADGRWGTPLYYLPHMRELPHRLCGALEAIADADAGVVLFHCGAGWDRTGLVAAVLLRALDVTTDAAAADYMRSFENAEAMAALHGRSFEVDERLEVLARFGHDAESAFRSMYEELDLEGWFRDAAVSEATIRAVRTWRGSVALRPAPMTP